MYGTASRFCPIPGRIESLDSATTLLIVQLETKACFHIVFLILVDIRLDEITAAKPLRLLHRHYKNMER
jgi:hypothetical protein